MTTKKAAPKKKATAKKSATKKASIKKATKKKSASKTTRKNTAKKQEPNIQISQMLKTKTVSGRATLTYNLGTASDGSIYMRISNSSGNGFYSKEWLAVEDIKALLDNIKDGNPITSFYLAPVFVGKSSNNAGYLAALLLAEAVLAPFEDKKRHYVYRGFDKLLAKVSKRKAA